MNNYKLNLVNFVIKLEYRIILKIIQNINNLYMDNIYKIYLISDSTGETLDRIFLALKAQFLNFKCSSYQYAFTRTENQITKILETCKKEKNSIILYTIVDTQLAKFLTNISNKENIPCFGVLGDLILRFSKLLNQRASHEIGGQHILDDEYFKKIEALKFTMAHDDGNGIEDIEESDIIILGVSRTSKTPTCIYLANRGFKTSNIPIISSIKLPNKIINKKKNICIIGLTTEPERLMDVRKNRMNLINENQSQEYTSLKNIEKEINLSKKLFRTYNWPTIDVTRKSVEETAASVIKIYNIINS